MQKIAIIGGGFAGVKLARQLSGNDYEVWLFDKNNFFQFQPLLYQVATSGLEPSSISFPLRKLFQEKKNFHIRNEEVDRIDTTNNKLVTANNVYSFDYLVIATGCTTNFFGNQTIQNNAVSMKSVSEALYLRNFILSNFEKALNVPVEKKQEYLNIVVVGGGPTGVEVSGAIAEMRKKILPKDYPELDFTKMNIYLVEAGEKTLGSMSAISSIKSKEYLEKMGVNVFTSTQVTDYNGEEVKFSNGKTIPTRTLIWAAGIKGNIIEGLKPEVITKGNRLKVNRFSQVEGYDSIFAIGDVAYMESPLYPKGQPQVATVANDQASNLYKNFKLLKDKKSMQQFEYANKGSMATIGKNMAVVDLPRISFQGFFAWLLWMFLHLMLILGVKNKLIVLLNWAWKYFTSDQSLRLIIKPFEPKTK
ncbi:MAG: NAD(P)/FAD-dependent oxidoreductase [Bacteroidota bacterium]|nr:NAD(P)/FAD-dependent oxidoreductase [Bacteroidota bacterium]